MQEHVHAHVYKCSIHWSSSQLPLFLIAEQLQEALPTINFNTNQHWDSQNIKFYILTLRFLADHVALISDLITSSYS